MSTLLLVLILILGVINFLFTCVVVAAVRQLQKCMEVVSQEQKATSKETQLAQSAVKRPQMQW